MHSTCDMTLYTYLTVPSLMPDTTFSETTRRTFSKMGISHKFFPFPPGSLTIFFVLLLNLFCDLLLKLVCVREERHNGNEKLSTTSSSVVPSSDKNLHKSPENPNGIQTICHISLKRSRLHYMHLPIWAASIWVTTSCGWHPVQQFMYGGLEKPKCRCGIAFRTSLCGDCGPIFYLFGNSSFRVCSKTNSTKLWLFKMASSLLL